MKREKIIAMMLAGVSAFSMCSCSGDKEKDKGGKKDPEKDLPLYESEKVTLDPDTVKIDTMNRTPFFDEQIEMIAEWKDIWYMDYEYGDVYYTLSDLDHNGRLEIISAICEGSGVYTYVTVYEMNESYNDLDLCYNSLEEGEAYPDIISAGKMDCYDQANLKYYYIVDDYVRGGRESSSLVRTSIFFYKGFTEIEWLAGEYNEDGNITYMDLIDNTEIDKETFDSFADTQYEGLRKGYLILDWATYDGEQDIVEFLTERLDGMDYYMPQE